MKNILFLCAILCVFGSTRSFAEAEGGGGEHTGDHGNNNGGWHPQPQPQPEQPANCSAWSWGSYSSYYKAFSTPEEALSQCFCPDQVTRVYDAWYHRYVFMCTRPDDGGHGNG